MDCMEFDSVPHLGVNKSSSVGFSKKCLYVCSRLVNSIFTAHEKPLALRVEYV